MLKSNSFVLPLLGLCLLQASPAIAETTEKVTEVAVAERTYPPLPEGQTKRITISAPSITVPPTISEKLGGSDLAEMLKMPMAKMLKESKRFRVLMEKEGSHKVTSSVTGLTISKAKSNETVDTVKKASKVFSGISSFIGRGEEQAKKAESAIEAADIVLNFTSDEEVVHFACEVTLNLLDGESELIDSWKGSITKAISIKEMRLKLGNVILAGDAPAPTVVTSYNTSVVEEALHSAILKMITPVDAIIKSPDFIELKSGSSPAPAPTAPAATPAAAPATPNPAK